MIVEPTETRLAEQFSYPDAATTPWAEAVKDMTAAQIWWISTVRGDGRPHVTPLMTVLEAEGLYFCTGPNEQKAKNLAASPCVTLTTGVNTWDGGSDFVVDGRAVRVTDDKRLKQLADRWVEKYGVEWTYDVAEGTFRHHGADGEAWVFEVRPDKIYAYDRERGGATRFTFS